MKTCQDKNERAVFQKLRMRSFAKSLETILFSTYKYSSNESSVVLYAPLL